MPRRRPRPLPRTESLLAVVALLLRRRSRPVRLRDIVRVTGRSERTAYRIAAAMVEAGLLEGSAGEGWRLRPLRRPRS